eukprot:gnl/Chilomastix_cuspidata/1156.p1 GENE.gnl/Chilomastix_cuspidata/1156~~gnl/Chilomastix_cuspidata/1156.p1  ORF type:complete len:1996 (+),score=421.07 gnl/Chilomastix_cuspidata/1156:545-6532(+)
MGRALTFLIFFAVAARGMLTFEELKDYNGLISDVSEKFLKLRNVRIVGDSMFVGDINNGQLTQLKRDGTGAWGICSYVRDGVADSMFGHSFGFYNELVIVGAPGKDYSAASAGHVKVFRLVNGKLDAAPVYTIDSPVASRNYQFGYAVDIYGDYAVIGATNMDYLRFGVLYFFQLDESGAATQVAQYEGDCGTLGQHVIIKENMAFATVIRDYLHVYRLEEDSWNRLPSTTQWHMQYVIEHNETVIVAGGSSTRTVRFSSYSHADGLSTIGSITGPYEEFGFGVSTNADGVTVAYSIVDGSVCFSFFRYFFENATSVEMFAMKEVAEYAEYSPYVSYQQSFLTSTEIALIFPASGQFYVFTGVQFLVPRTEIVSYTAASILFYGIDDELVTEQVNFEVEGFTISGFDAATGKHTLAGPITLLDDAPISIRPADFVSVIFSYVYVKVRTSVHYKVFGIESTCVADVSCSVDFKLRFGEGVTVEEAIIVKAAWTGDYVTPASFNSETNTFRVLLPGKRTSGVFTVDFFMGQRFPAVESANITVADPFGLVSFSVSPDPPTSDGYTISFAVVDAYGEAITDESELDVKISSDGSSHDYDVSYDNQLFTVDLECPFPVGAVTLNVSLDSYWQDFTKSFTVAQAPVTGIASYYSVHTRSDEIAATVIECVSVSGTCQMVEVSLCTFKGVTEPPMLCMDHLCVVTIDASDVGTFELVAVVPGRGNFSTPITILPEPAGYLNLSTSSFTAGERSVATAATIVDLNYLPLTYKSISSASLSNGDPVAVSSCENGVCLLVLDVPTDATSYILSATLDDSSRVTADVTVVYGKPARISSVEISATPPTTDGFSIKFCLENDFGVLVPELKGLAAGFDSDTETHVLGLSGYSGCYEASVDPTRIGDYTLTATYDGETFATQPIPVYSGVYAKWGFSSDAVTVADPAAMVTITFYDADDNVATGTELFSLLINRKSPTSFACSNGECEVVFEAPDSLGELVFDAMFEPEGADKYTVHVVYGDPHHVNELLAYNSEIFLLFAPTIEGFDAYFDVRNKFNVSIADLAGVSVSLTQGADTYEFDAVYTNSSTFFYHVSDIIVHKSGNYTLAFLYGGTEFASQIFYIYSGLIDHWLLSSSRIVAAAPAERITITLYDRNNNLANYENIRSVSLDGVPQTIESRSEGKIGLLIKAPATVGTKKLTLYSLNNYYIQITVCYGPPDRISEVQAAPSPPTTEGFSVSFVLENAYGVSIPSYPFKIASLTCGAESHESSVSNPGGGLVYETEKFNPAATGNFVFEVFYFDELIDAQSITVHSTAACAISFSETQFVVGAESASVTLSILDIDGNTADSYAVSAVSVNGSAGVVHSCSSGVCSATFSIPTAVGSHAFKATVDGLEFSNEIAVVYGEPARVANVSSSPSAPTVDGFDVCFSVENEYGVAIRDLSSLTVAISCDEKYVTLSTTHLGDGDVYTTVGRYNVDAGACLLTFVSGGVDFDTQVITVASGRADMFSLSSGAIMAGNPAASVRFTVQDRKGNTAASDGITEVLFLTEAVLSFQCDAGDCSASFPAPSIPGAYILTGISASGGNPWCRVTVEYGAIAALEELETSPEPALTSGFSLTAYFFNIYNVTINEDRNVFVEFDTNSEACVRDPSSGRFMATFASSNNGTFALAFAEGGTAFGADEKITVYNPADTVIVGIEIEDTTAGNPDAGVNIHISQADGHESSGITITDVGFIPSEKQSRVRQAMSIPCTSVLCFFSVALPVDCANNILRITFSTGEVRLHEIALDYGNVTQTKLIIGARTGGDAYALRIILYNCYGVTILDGRRVILVLDDAAPIEFVFVPELQDYTAEAAASIAELRAARVFIADATTPTPHDTVSERTLPWLLLAVLAVVVAAVCTGIVLLCCCCRRRHAAATRALADMPHDSVCALECTSVCASVSKSPHVSSCVSAGMSENAVYPESESIISRMAPSISSCVAASAADAVALSEIPSEPCAPVCTAEDTAR